jgi:hypothetical protein
LWIQKLSNDYQVRPYKDVKAQLAYKWCYEVELVYLEMLSAAEARIPDLREILEYVSSVAPSNKPLAETIYDFILVETDGYADTLLMYDIMTRFKKKHPLGGTPHSPPTNKYKEIYCKFNYLIKDNS